jgi:hypothetical protein
MKGAIIGKKPPPKEHPSQNLEEIPSGERKLKTQQNNY